jgi:hypothetical protein
MEWIEGRGTLDLFTFRKALSANPLAHGPLLGHALPDIHHHFMVLLCDKMRRRQHGQRGNERAMMRPQCVHQSLAYTRR